MLLGPPEECRHVLLSYAATAQTSLDEKIKSATKEWTEADGADREYQRLLTLVRDTAATFDRELIAFRETPANIASRKDEDRRDCREIRGWTIRTVALSRQ